MMEEWYFHIIDVVHGIVMTILVYFMFRLLIFRKEGVLRVRYLAAGLLLLALLQTFNYFMEESKNTSLNLSEYIALITDGGALLLSLLILWLFYRNRHIYPVSILLIGSGTLIAIILSYVFCALFRFEEWTYIIYLLFSTAGWILLSLIIERIPETSGLLEQKSAPFVDQWSEFRKQLDEVMHKDDLFCNEELTREDVCRAMCTNRTTFSQKLKQAYDKTFSEYLRDLRLAEAARLLCDTDMPIDQVAFSVGIKSASGFYRNFLLSYGMTPMQYRTKHSKKQ